MNLRLYIIFILVLVLSKNAYATKIEVEGLPVGKTSHSFEIASDATFTAIAYKTQNFANGKVRWDNAKIDQVYHWRVVDTKDPKAQLERGSLVVIGPGKGFLTIVWDEVSGAKSSYDLEVVTATGGISIERLSQNWSSRKRGKVAQVNRIYVSGTGPNNGSSSTFFPSLALVETESKSVADKRAPTQSVSKSSGAKSKPLSSEKPSSVPGVSAFKMVESSRSPPVTTFAFPSLRLAPVMGGGLFSSTRTKKEIEIQSSQPLFTAGFEVSMKVLSSFRLGVGFAERISGGQAVIESEFDLPEVNLPKHSRDYHAGVSWVKNINRIIEIDFGVGATEQYSWGLPLAYSSLDGGALFEKRKQFFWGPNLQIAALLGNRSIVDFQNRIHFDSRNVDNLLWTTALSWRWHWNRNFDTGLHFQYEAEKSSACHNDGMTCEREGKVSEKESLILGMLSLGYVISDQ